MCVPPLMTGCDPGAAWKTTLYPLLPLSRGVMSSVWFRTYGSAASPSKLMMIFPLIGEPVMLGSVFATTSARVPGDDELKPLPPPEGDTQSIESDQRIRGSIRSME